MLTALRERREAIGKWFMSDEYRALESALRKLEGRPLEEKPEPMPPIAAMPKPRGSRRR